MFGFCFLVKYVVVFVFVVGIRIKFKTNKEVDQPTTNHSASHSQLTNLFFVDFGILFVGNSVISFY